MATRRKPLRKTVVRGYGAEHKRLRARLLAAYQPTDPCARCGWPLGNDPARIQLGHTDQRDGYTGLEHSACNVGASNKRRARPRRQPRARRKTAARPAPASPQAVPGRQHARDW